jgi:hypothetical protein
VRQLHPVAGAWRAAPRRAPPVTVGTPGCRRAGRGALTRRPRRAAQVDITEGIQKQCTVLWCKECNRWLNVRAAARTPAPAPRSAPHAPARATPAQPPKAWMRAELESKELLTFCVKKVKGLAKVKLVDAGFVWTEPHSRRLKLKLTVQAEVLNGAILQQTFVVEARARGSRRSGAAGARHGGAACGAAAAAR